MKLKPREADILIEHIKLHPRFYEQLFAPSFVEDMSKFEDSVISDRNAILEFEKTADQYLQYNIQLLRTGLMPKTASLPTAEKPNIPFADPKSRVGQLRKTIQQEIRFPASGDKLVDEHNRKLRLLRDAARDLFEFVKTDDSKRKVAKVKENADFKLLRARLIAMDDLPGEFTAPVLLDDLAQNFEAYKIQYSVAEKADNGRAVLPESEQYVIMDDDDARQSQVEMLMTLKNSEYAKVIAAVYRRWLVDKYNDIKKRDAKQEFIINELLIILAAIKNKRVDQAYNINKQGYAEQLCTGFLKDIMHMFHINYADLQKEKFNHEPESEFMLNVIQRFAIFSEEEKKKFIACLDEIVSPRDRDTLAPVVLYNIKQIYSYAINKAHELWPEGSTIDYKGVSVLELVGECLEAQTGFENFYHQMHNADGLDAAYSAALNVALLNNVRNEVLNFLKNCTKYEVEDKSLLEVIELCVANNAKCENRDPESDDEDATFVVDNMNMYFWITERLRDQIGEMTVSGEYSRLVEEAAMDSGIKEKLNNLYNNKFLKIGLHDPRGATKGDILEFIEQFRSDVLLRQEANPQPTSPKLRR